MDNVNSLKAGDIVLVKCKVVAVFTGGQMAMVTTRDCEKGFDAYSDEIEGLYHGGCKEIDGYLYYD